MLRRRKKLFGGARFNPLVYSPALWLDASDIATLVMDGARTFASASSQYLSCADNASLRLGPVDFWYAGWFYPTANKVNYIGQKFASTNNSDFRLTHLSGATLQFDAYYSPNTQVAVTATSVSLNTWNFFFAYHIVANKKLYLCINNGVINESSSYATTLLTSNAPLTISVSGASGMDGRMDSIAFGKPATGWLASNATALRDYLYNGGSGRRSSDFLASSYYTEGNPSGAVSWWDMDARSGTELDRIGTNHLTDNGGVGYAAGVASGLVQYTGDPVKQWSDKSGNARHLIAPSDAARPTYTTGAQNGLSVLAYDGLNDILTNTDAASLLTGSNRSLTAFVVVRDNASSSVAFGFGRSTVSAVPFYAVYPYSTTKGRAVYRTDSNAETNLLSSATSSGVTYLLTAKIDANVSYLSVDGGAFASSAINSSGATLDTFAVGALNRFGGAGNFLSGYICELLLYGSGLASGPVTLINRYLGNKWGITVP